MIVPRLPAADRTAVRIDGGRNYHLILVASKKGATGKTQPRTISTLKAG